MPGSQSTQDARPVHPGRLGLLVQADVQAGTARPKPGPGLHKALAMNHGSYRDRLNVEINPMCACATCSPG